VCAEAAEASCRCVVDGVERLVVVLEVLLEERSLQLTETGHDVTCRGPYLHVTIIIRSQPQSDASHECAARETFARKWFHTVFVFHSAILVRDSSIFNALVLT